MVTEGSKWRAGVASGELARGVVEDLVPDRVAEEVVETSARASVRPLDVGAVYTEHAEFVWRNLFRLGVREQDLEDMVQEVFVVVHRRIDRFDGSSRVTTWLFGIAMRVAAAYHRRAYRRRERATDFDDGAATLPDAAARDSPEDMAARREAGGTLERILGAMEIEKRATFVLFEIESMSCAEIAALTDVPVGTVYSRLHAARAVFEREAARLRDTRRGRR